MTKKIDTLVYIGRFQPLHNAHLKTIREAANIADKVIVIVGSSNQPRTFKNPFTFEERKKIIKDALFEFHLGNRVVVESNIDTIYDDDAWVIRVQEIVSNHTKPTDNVRLIGFNKDKDTARYLRMFPQWSPLVEVPHEEILSATEIRDLYLKNESNLNYIRGVVPEATLNFLTDFKTTSEFSHIVAEKEFIEAYRKEKEVYKYPIIAVTVDAVVVQAGHILLIRRRSIPGKGLWALPGGYFDAEKDVTTLDGVIRELKEETKINLPEKVIRGSVKEVREFCAPGRSLLGRSITFAAHISLQDGEWNLPKVKGSDDADKAVWVPLSEVRRETLFDDHADIIQSYIPSISL